jgi:hypothetical protein
MFHSLSVPLIAFLYLCPSLPQYLPEHFCLFSTFLCIGRDLRDWRTLTCLFYLRLYLHRPFYLILYSATVVRYFCLSLLLPFCSSVFLFLSFHVSAFFLTMSFILSDFSASVFLHLRLSLFLPFAESVSLCLCLRLPLTVFPLLSHVLLYRMISGQPL